MPGDVATGDAHIDHHQRNSTTSSAHETNLFSCFLLDSLTPQLLITEVLRGPGRVLQLKIKDGLRVAMKVSSAGNLFFQVPSRASFRLHTACAIVWTTLQNRSFFQKSAASCALDGDTSSLGLLMFVSTFVVVFFLSIRAGAAAVGGAQDGQGEVRHHPGMLHGPCEAAGCAAGAVHALRL